MDRKSIVVVVVCFVLMILWFPLVNKFSPPSESPADTDGVAGATNQVAAGPNQPATTAATTTGALATNAPAQVFVPPDAPEMLLLLTWTLDVPSTFRPTKLLWIAVLLIVARALPPLVLI